MELLNIFDNWNFLLMTVSVLFIHLVGYFIAKIIQKKQSGNWMREIGYYEEHGTLVYDRTKNVYYCKCKDSHPQNKDDFPTPVRRCRFWSFVSILFTEFLFVPIILKDCIVGVFLYVMFLLLYQTIVCAILVRRIECVVEKKVESSTNPRFEYKNFWYNYEVRYLLSWAPWVMWPFWWKQKRKLNERADYYCPQCHQPMEEDGTFLFPEEYVVEDAIGAMKRFPYRCQLGHVLVVKDVGKHFQKSGKCDNCCAITAKETWSKVVRKNSYSRDGILKVSYQCMRCGDSFIRFKKIPKIKEESIGSSIGGTVIDTIFEPFFFGK